MAILKFGQECWQRVLSGNDGGGPFLNGSVSDNRLGTPSLIRGLKYSNSRLVVFAGTMPTKAALEDGSAANTLGTVLFVLNTNTSKWSQLDDIMVYNTSEQANALASGTAAFWIIAGDWGTTGNDSNRESTIIAGDITTPGGGGSLVMSDTTIVAGNPYTVSEIRLQLPRTFG